MIIIGDKALNDGRFGKIQVDSGKTDADFGPPLAVAVFAVQKNAVTAENGENLPLTVTAAMDFCVPAPDNGLIGHRKQKRPGEPCSSPSHSRY